MKIVLLERVEKLGKMGDVLTVKNGYGRNYLLPQKKALRATAENIAHFEKQKATLQAESKELQTKAEGIATKIEKIELIMIRQASQAGNLYGSVSSRDVAKALEEKGAHINHSMVKIESPIKMIGVHKVKIILHPEVITHVAISIAPSEDEADAFLKNPNLSLDQNKNEVQADDGIQETMDTTESAQ